MRASVRVECVHAYVERGLGWRWWKVDARCLPAFLTRLPHPPSHFPDSPTPPHNPYLSHVLGCTQNHTAAQAHGCTPGQALAPGTGLLSPVSSLSWHGSAPGKQQMQPSPDRFRALPSLSQSVKMLKSGRARGS